MNMSHHIVTSRVCAVASSVTESVVTQFISCIFSMAANNVWRKESIVLEFWWSIFFKRKGLWGKKNIKEEEARGYFALGVALLHFRTEKCLAFRQETFVEVTYNHHTITARVERTSAYLWLLLVIVLFNDIRSGEHEKYQTVLHCCIPYYTVLPHFGTKWQKNEVDSTRGHFTDLSYCITQLANIHPYCLKAARKILQEDMYYLKSLSSSYRGGFWLVHIIFFFYLLYSRTQPETLICGRQLLHYGNFYQ